MTTVSIREEPTFPLSSVGVMVTSYPAAGASIMSMITWISPAFRNIINVTIVLSHNKNECPTGGSAKGLYN